MAPPAPPKLKYNGKAKDNAGDGDDDDGIDFNVALEEAIAKLGLTIDQVKAMLEDVSNFPPPALLAEIAKSTGCTDKSKITKALLPQRAAVLDKVKKSIKERNRAKSVEEAKVQRALQAIGKCCMGFEWLKVEGGYRCAGGSHFCTDQEINMQQLAEGQSQ